MSAIHFYWAAGGEYGFTAALPTTENGERILNPSPLESVVVGVALTAFALFYMFRSGIMTQYVAQWMETYIGWSIPAISIVRALADFKYVGFFKQVTETEFARLDTLFYSPLCLTIGVVGIIIQLMR